MRHKAPVGADDARGALLRAGALGERPRESVLKDVVPILALAGRVASEAQVGVKAGEPRVLLGESIACGVAIDGGDDHAPRRERGEDLVQDRQLVGARRAGAAEIPLRESLARIERVVAHGIDGALGDDDGSVDGDSVGSASAGLPAGGTEGSHSHDVPL